MFGEQHSWQKQLQGQRTQGLLGKEARLSGSLRGEELGGSEDGEAMRDPVEPCGPLGGPWLERGAEPLRGLEERYKEASCPLGCRELRAAAGAR